MMPRKIVLVEGADDEHVLKHVCGNRGLPRIDEIKQYGGVNNLLENFPVRLKESDVDALGVVIDADTDLAARWNSLKDRLLRAGYEAVPKKPLPIGTILEPPENSLLPRVGIWIMPDNQTTGLLENFLQFLVPQGSELFQYIKLSVANIPDNEKRFSKLAEPKALIHAWLALQEEPGKPLGLAITSRYLDHNVEQVDQFVSWLERLLWP